MKPGGSSSGKRSTSKLHSLGVTHRNISINFDLDHRNQFIISQICIFFLRFIEHVVNYNFKGNDNGVKLLVCFHFSQTPDHFHGNLILMTDCKKFVLSYYYYLR